MTPEQRAAVLGTTALFRSLDPEALQRLGEQSADRTYDDGGQLYPQEAPADELYVVASGEVALSVEGKGVVSNKRASDVFGEAALYDEDGGRMVSARAAEQAEVVILPAEVFRTTVRERPDVAEALLRHMASVIRTSTAS